MNSLPKDPLLLLSVLNAKLRDCYTTLDQLCDDLSVDKEELLATMHRIDYEYDADCNQFK